MLIFLLIISSSLVSPDPNSRGLETVQEKNNDNNPKIEVNGKKEINIQKENVRYFKSPKGIIAINANAFAENAKSGSKFTIQKAETDRQFFFPFFGFWGMMAAIRWPLALFSLAG